MAFFVAARCGLRLLDLRGQLVALEHPLQHLLLGRAQVLLRGLDFVLHGLVFAVGLDRRQLILELGQPALEDGGVLFDGAALLLAGFQAFGGLGHDSLGFFQARVGVGDALRMGGDRRAGLGDGGVELLKLNQSFELWRH